jgi:hypothetical protein
VGFKEVGAELVEIFSQRAAVATPRAATGVGSAATPEGNRVVEPARRRLEAPLAALSEAVDAYVTDADPGGDVAALMRRGLDALRRYAEDRDRGDYVGALDSFVEARLSDRLAAAAWFGEGIAHAHGPELEIPDATGYQHRRVRMETAAELSARRAFVRAVELDPSRPGPAIELAALALATRKGSAIDTADAAIATVLDRAAADAELLTSASLVAAANGDAARAADLAERAVEAGGGSAALHALGSALVRIDGREEAGAAAYLRGIDEQDDTGARRYRDDARFIASPADLEAMNELTPGLRSFHLRALWERTAAENAMTVGERLAVHMQRLDTAQARFRRQLLRGAQPFDALWVDTVATDVPIDGRGMVYVRHGPPAEIIVSVPDSRGRIGPNETWVYRRGQQSTLFHFMKMDGSPDWELTAGPPCDPLYYRTGEHGERSLASLVSMAPEGGVASPFNYMEAYERWHQDRMGVEPALYGDAVRCLAAAHRLDQAIANRDEAAIREAIAGVDDEWRGWLTRRAELTEAASRSLTTEEAILRFDRPLGMLTSLYTFRGSDGQTDVVAAILVPGDELTPGAGGEEVAYTMRLSLILMDPPHERVFRTDTVVAYRSDEPLAEGRYLRTFAVVRTAAMDAMDFRLAVRNDGVMAEGRVQSGRISVPDYGRRAISVSDLVIAEPVDGAWNRGIVRLSPIPTHQVDSGASFRLYYEVYSLEEGNALSTRIRIRPVDGSGLLSRIGQLFGGQNNEIDLRFDDVATAPGELGLQYLREISGELDAGSYIVTVTVRDPATDEESTRETRLNVNAAPGQPRQPQAGRPLHASMSGGGCCGFRSCREGNLRKSECQRHTANAVARRALSRNGLAVRRLWVGMQRYGLSLRGWSDRLHNGMCPTPGASNVCPLGSSSDRHDYRADDGRRRFQVQPARTPSDDLLRGRRVRCRRGRRPPGWRGCRRHPGDGDPVHESA